VILLAACASSPPPPPNLVASHCGPPPVQAALAPAGEAHIIEKTGTTGVISLSGDHAIAIERAYALMAQHCGEGNWKVTVDEQVAMADIFSPAIYDEAIDYTERKIHYACT
jgi:hypothetical protein